MFKQSREGADHSAPSLLLWIIRCSYLSAIHPYFSFWFSSAFGT
jgi:hypothetical protein